MQKPLSRFWTQITNSISYRDNRYAMSGENDDLVLLETNLIYLHQTLYYVIYIVAPEMVTNENANMDIR